MMTLECYTQRSSGFKFNIKLDTTPGDLLTSLNSSSSVLACQIQIYNITHSNRAQCFVYLKVGFANEIINF